MLSLEEKRSPRLLRRKAPDPNIGSHLPPPPGAAPPPPPLSTSPQPPAESQEVSPLRDGRQSVAAGMGGGVMVPYNGGGAINNNMMGMMMQPPTHLLNFQDAVAHMALMGDGMYTSSSPRDGFPSKPLEYEPIPVERIFGHHAPPRGNGQQPSNTTAYSGPGGGGGGRGATRGSHMALPLLPSDPRMLQPLGGGGGNAYPPPPPAPQHNYIPQYIPAPPPMDISAAVAANSHALMKLLGGAYGGGIVDPAALYEEDASRQLEACNRVAERQLDALDLWFAALHSQQSLQSRATTQGGMMMGGGGWAPSAAGGSRQAALPLDQPELPARTKLIHSPRQHAAQR